MKNRWA